MRKFAIGLLLVALAFLGYAVTEADAAPAAQSIAPAAAQTAYHPAATGKKFADDWICAENNIGSYWDWRAAGNAFESGLTDGNPNTVYMDNQDPDQSCANYPANQTLAYEVYSADDGRCWQMSYHSYLGNYTSRVTVWMNNSASTYWCRDTAQNRNNVASRAIGTALGLLQFYSDGPAGQSSIMNTKFVNLYNHAGTDDRNSLWDIYGGGSSAPGTGSVPAAMFPRGATAVQEGAPGYRGWRYAGKSICVLDGLGTQSLYDVGWTANSWESGTSTVITGYRTAAQGCNDYPAYQRLRVYFYSAPDNLCGKVTTTNLTLATDPENPYYTQLHSSDNGGPAIWLNNFYYDGCRETAVNRSHLLSSLEGYVFGVRVYRDCTLNNYDVQNDCEWSRDNIAGAWAVNRNQIFNLMNP